jgi:pheromone shutdown protein TraB
MTDADVVTAMMEEFRRFSPGGAEALIDERDAFIAHRLVALRQAGYRVVAVVGAGHREGIETYLENPETLPPMESLVGTAEKSGLGKVVYKAIGYAITLGFLAFFVLLALGGAQEAYLVELFVAWFVVNAVLAGGLARLGGARWPSAAVGGGVAWLTSVNPLLAPGWFAGYVELRYQAVSVADIDELNTILGDESAPISDIVTRLREVPLFRLILVVALTNIGSMLASLVVFPAILPWLSADIGGVAAIGGLLVDGAQNGWEIIWGALT